MKETQGTGKVPFYESVFRQNINSDKTESVETELKLTEIICDAIVNSDKTESVETEVICDEE